MNTGMLTYQNIRQKIGGHNKGGGSVMSMMQKLGLQFSRVDKFVISDKILQGVWNHNSFK